MNEMISRIDFHYQRSGGPGVRAGRRSRCDECLVVCVRARARVRVYMRGLARPAVFWLAEFFCAGA